MTGYMYVCRIGFYKPNKTVLETVIERYEPALYTCIGFEYRTVWIREQ
jgi:hypothetical protein